MCLRDIVQLLKTVGAEENSFLMIMGALERPRVNYGNI